MTTPQIAHWKDGDQHRAFKRFAIEFTVPVNSVLDDAFPDTAAASRISALVTNVSMSGLAFTSPLQFPMGTALQLEIKINTKNFSLPVVVRRCTAIRRPRRIVYGCGVQYVKSGAATEFIPALAKYLTQCGVLNEG